MKRPWARGCLDDPARILDHVMNHIRYEHYYGCRRGAMLTWLEEAGNDFDQCTLLVALLRDAATRNPAITNVRYRYGKVNIPLTAGSDQDLSHWLGLTSYTQVAYFSITEGGFPFAYPTNAEGVTPADAVDWYSNAIYLPHVWVEAEIDGVTRVFDPAFQISDWLPASSWLTQTGYTQSALLSAAGGTATANDVQNMSRSALENYLSGRASALISYLQAADDRANFSLPEMLGGPVKRLHHTPALPQALGYPLISDIGTWTEIPEEHASKLTLASTGTGLSWSIPLPELRGRCLSLRFDSASPKTGRLYFDGASSPVTSESAPSGSSLQIQFSITHDVRFYDNNSATPVGIRDQLNVARTFNRGAVFALPFSLTCGDRRVRERQRVLADYMDSGLPSTDPVVLAETLHILGLTYYRNCHRLVSLIDRVSGCRHLWHHLFGRMGTEDGYFVDIFMNNFAQGDETDYLAHSPGGFYPKVTEASMGLMSAMEHGVIPELQGSSEEGASTVRVLAAACDAGQPIYLMHSGNSAWVKSQLAASYPAATKNQLEANANAGHLILLPQSYAIPIDQWTGGAWIDLIPSANFRDYSISGTLNGGESTSGNSLNPGAATSSFWSSPFFSWLQSLTQFFRWGADPVDMASGAFVVDRSDLVLGDGSEPSGLRFNRTYTTRSRLQDPTGLGRGWTHNYDIRLTQRSDALEATGSASPFQCALQLVAAQAVFDLVDTTSPQKWLASLLSANFAVNAINGNAVTVTIGPRVLQFIRHPNGTDFISPPGVAASLVTTATGHELTFRHGNTLVFDSNGLGVTIRDTFGKQASLAYAGGRLNTVTDCWGRSLSLHYTGSQLTSVTDSTGRSVSYGHDPAALDHLISATDAEGSVWFYDTDARHRIEQLREPLNSQNQTRVITHNTFDLFDRVIEQRSQGDAAQLWSLFYTERETVEQDPSGALRETRYDAKSRLIAEIDAAGRTTRRSYDGQDHPASVTDPADHSLTTIWSGDHLPLVVTDPESHTTQMFYDAQRRLDHVINARGKTTTHSFNAQHLPTGQTSAEGVTTSTEYYPIGHAHAGLVRYLRVHDGALIHTTEFQYDANGHLSTLIHPDAVAESFLHHARGDLTSHTDRRSITTTFDYNARRQLRHRYLPTVNATSYTEEIVYDSAGLASQSMDRFGRITLQTYSATQKPLVTTFPNLTTLSQFYDTRDWLESQYNQEGAVSQTLYHPDGHPHQAIDPLLRLRLQTDYDAAGRLQTRGSPRPNSNPGLAETTTTYTDRGQPWQITDTLGHLTTFSYDANGNLLTLLNRRGHTWTWTYNDDDQMQDLVSPLGKTSHRDYNARGLLQTTTAPSGQTTTLTYDSLGRPSTATDAVATRTFAYETGANHRIDTVTEGALTIERETDALGRLIRYQHGSDYTLQWIYHDPQQAVSLVYPDGKQVRYDFDSMGRLWKVTDWAARLTTYQYDAANRLTWTHRPNGTARHVTYDLAGQPSGIEELDAAGHLIALYQFSAYWDNGQVKQQFVLPPPQPWSQLTTPVMTYDADNRLATWNGQAISHDNDGNTTSGPIKPPNPSATPTLASLDFDARHRLTSVSAAGQPTVAYGYDLENQRTSVTTNSQTTLWTHNPHGISGLSEALIRQAPSGASLTRYVYGLGLLYEEDDTTGQTLTYHFTAQGSTAALSTDDGITLTDRVEYSPYGQITHRTGSTDTPFLFHGHYGVQTCAITGLLHMRARHYNPETRRFQSADPLGFAASSNWYAFVNGDPISLTDPFGLAAMDAMRSFGGAMGNAVRNTGTTFAEILNQVGSLKLISAVRLMAGYPFSIASGDLFDAPTHFQAQAIYFPGMLTNPDMHLQAANTLAAILNGAETTRVNNNTHFGGLGDILQILGETFGAITISSIWGADAIRQAGAGGIFMWSQGSRVGNNALTLAGRSLASNFAGHTVGGEAYSSGFLTGLASSRNIRTSGDWVPLLTPWNWPSLLSGQWESATSPIPGIVGQHDIYNYLRYINPN